MSAGVAHLDAGTEATARPNRAETEVLVINLSDATYRMEFQNEQLAQLGLKFRRIEAVSKADISDEVLSDYSSRAPRPLIPAELACLLSHAECWTHIVKQCKPALVVEDDAVLSARLPEALDKLARISEQRVVNLETFLDDPKYLAKKSFADGLLDACDLHVVIKGSAGAAAYLLGPAIAQRLLAALDDRVALADTFLGINSGARNLQTVPALAAQMMTLQVVYGAKFKDLTRSTVLTAEESAARASKIIKQPSRTPAGVLQRLRLELRVGLEKLEATLIGQKLTIQPCPDLLSRWA